MPPKGHTMSSHGCKLGQDGNPEGMSGRGLIGSRLTPGKKSPCNGYHDSSRKGSYSPPQPSFPSGLWMTLTSLLRSR